MRDPYQRELVLCTFAIRLDELQVGKEISNDGLQHRDYADNRNRVKINRNIRAKVCWWRMRDKRCVLLFRIIYSIYIE